MKPTMIAAMIASFVFLFYHYGRCPHGTSGLTTDEEVES